MNQIKLNSFLIQFFKYLLNLKKRLNCNGLYLLFNIALNFKYISMVIENKSVIINASHIHTNSYIFGVFIFIEKHFIS